jgi:formylglycine-generating enzyme required for sulfatase activity
MNDAEGLTNSIGMRFVRITADSFMIGSPETEAGRDEDEDEDERQHKVILSQDYWLCITPVTQAQYRQVMGTDPSEFKGADRPVETVSWQDVTKFCRWLSDLPEERAADRVYRLPTEAEWEYACRAGSTTAYSFGDDPQQLGDHGWFGSNSGSETHPVGQKQPNAWGLYDMHGNVNDWFQRLVRGLSEECSS